MTTHHRNDPLARLLGTMDTTVTQAPEPSIQPADLSVTAATKGQEPETQPGPLRSATKRRARRHASSRDARAEVLAPGQSGSASGGADQAGRNEVAAAGEVLGGERLVTMPGNAAKETEIEPSEPPGAILESMTATIERAQEYADRYPEPYRPEIFRVALGALLGGNSLSRAFSGYPATHTGTGAAGATPEAPDPVAHHITVRGMPLTPSEKLARQLNVVAEDVERAVMFGDDGRITILGHVDGRTKKELQTRYGLVYCYVKEVGLAEALVDVEELRRLCIDHGCYDLANFTANYTKDVKAGLLREDGGKGSRVRRYRATRRGLDAAAALLREMTTQ